ncbi:MAG: response regulator [Nitrospirae bacterium]|nr:MAG: response regulator [Nitrospirota bacterium]
MNVGRVVIIDDDPELRRATRLVLTKAGYDAFEAADGEQGIAVIRSGDPPINAIICDLDMPRVNGMEAIAYFHAHCPSVPVIVMTGTGDLNIATELYKQGIVDFLSKPVLPETLVRSVEKAMKLHH